MFEWVAVANNNSVNSVAFVNFMNFDTCFKIYSFIYLNYFIVSGANIFFRGYSIECHSIESQSHSIYLRIYNFIVIFIFVKNLKVTCPTVFKFAEVERQAERTNNQYPVKCHT